jgi:hypothetical protein
MQREDWCLIDCVHNARGAHCAGVERITSVFRVGRLDNPQNRYKVDINAKENHMTGGGCERVRVVVCVAGGGWRWHNARQTTERLHAVCAPPLVASREQGCT